MRKFYTGVVRSRRLIIVIFVVLFAVCFVCSKLVGVNYDIKDYLPENTDSTVSLQIMNEEFLGGVPNARVMIRDVTVPEALEFKEKLKNITGVSGVTWLDDSVDITIPLPMLDEDTVSAHYKDGCAVFSLTVSGEHRLEAVKEIRALAGEDGAVAGSVVSTADATETTVKEVSLVTAIAIAFVLIVLILTTHTWLEPIIVLVGLGLAIMLNNGSNIIFGEISFVTNAAGSVLLLAVALDYSVFLLHRFRECRKSCDSAEEAMIEALCRSTSSILSSGLTTVIGFVALILMRFRLGGDLGLALSKGVVISLLTVFLFTPSLLLCVHKLSDKLSHRALMPSFKGLGKAVFKIAVPMACIFAIVIVPAYLGSNANEYLYGSSEIFDADTRFGKDTAAINEVFGQSDTYVLMVPKGDTATQKLISDELHALDGVDSIISYVDMAGAEIPPSYLDESTLALLEGENYSRMVISVNLPPEGEATFALVGEIREIAEKYYPSEAYLVGEGVSTFDLKETITSDMLLVNLLAIGAIFVILLITQRSLFTPVVLVLCIETAIFINLSFPYFSSEPLFYLAYLIISSVQLGATVDYAILMTDRYKENRLTLERKDALIQTVSDTFVSIMTSGSAMTVVGFLLGAISTNRIIAQLGILIGRGAIFSLIIVIFVLPGLLYIFDKLVKRKKKAKGQNTATVTEVNA